MNRNKKIRVFVYENKPGSHFVDHSGQHYVITKSGTRRKVLIDKDGKPYAYETKSR